MNKRRRKKQFNQRYRGQWCEYWKEEKMDRIQLLNKRIEDMEVKQRSERDFYPNDKPKLAAAIRFSAGMALFIAAFFLHWHWGWITAIGVVTVGLSMEDL